MHCVVCEKLTGNGNVSTLSWVRCPAYKQSICMIHCSKCKHYNKDMPIVSCGWHRRKRGENGANAL